MSAAQTSCAIVVPALNAGSPPGWVVGDTWTRPWRGFLWTPGALASQTRRHSKTAAVQVHHSVLFSSSSSSSSTRWYMCTHTNDTSSWREHMLYSHGGCLVNNKDDGRRGIWFLSLSPSLPLSLSPSRVTYSLLVP